MGFGTVPGQSPLNYVGIKETDPPQIIKQNRAPTSADFRNVSPGDVWLDTLNIEAYICTLVAGSTATWILMASSSTDFSTMTTDDGGSFNGPTADFTGANGLQTTASGSTVTYQFTPVGSGFAGSQREFAQAGIQTTDATPTAIANISLATNETISVRARFNGFRDDYTASLVGEVFYGARAAGGGAVEIQAPIVDILEDSGGSPSIDADVSGSDIRLLVTGVAAQNWNWVVSYEYHGVITNS